MNNTFALYNDRVNELEFYFTIMSEIDDNSGAIRTIDNRRLLRIFKSNYLLMLYNFIEACVVSGMMEIYESVKNSGSTYNDLINEIRYLWSNYEIGKIYSNNVGRKAYEDRVHSIIDQVITGQPIGLNRDSLGISGNLDARIIKKLCDKHRIRYVVPDDDGSLRIVKRKRNNLAHGDESFGDSARDMSLSDIEHIKDEVVRFIKGILEGMRVYYDNKHYLNNTAVQ